MSKYIVSVPIAGAIHIEVEASNVHDAKKRAWERINAEGDDAGEVEWEFFDSLGEGNVSHAPLDRTEVNRVRGGK